MKTVSIILCIASFCIALSSCKKNDENTNNPENSSCKIMKFESDEVVGLILSYSYSTEGNLLNVVSSAPNFYELFTYKYDINNRISYETRLNNDTIFYYYDDHDLVTSAIYKAASGTYDTSKFEYNTNHQLIKREYSTPHFQWNSTYEWGNDGNVLTAKHYNIVNELLSTETYEYDSQHNKDLTNMRPLWEPKNVNNIKTISSNGQVYRTYNYTQYNSKGFPTQYTSIISNGPTENVTITYECP
jgi:hypothetical protein